ncbi:MAG: xanthine phosphoribosyltransferase, partial [Bacilli bacterium]
MEKLKQMIIDEGYVIEPDILKVDKFINHQMDIALFKEMGVHFKKHFNKQKVDRILTIEASGIGIASLVSLSFDMVPVVFAKKQQSAITGHTFYSSNVYSYTKKVNSTIIVDTRFIQEGENILIIDDFLANGQAALGLIDICRQAKANVVGVGIAIEKGFQEGRKHINEAGVDVYSLAIVDSFLDGKVVFKENNEEL